MIAKFMKIAAKKILGEAAVMLFGAAILLWFCVLPFVAVAWFGALFDEQLRPWAAITGITHGIPVIAAFCASVYDEVKENG